MNTIGPDERALSPTTAPEIDTTSPTRVDRGTEPSENTQSSASPTQLAGVVGLVTGLGALIALTVFLRLPSLFQRFGANPALALTYSYYIVGVLAILASMTCFLGLRHLRGENGKGWNMVFPDKVEGAAVSRRGYSVFESVKMSITHPSLGLAYLGGFVARASSVAISTFIPLFVNAYYISSGFCDANDRDPKDLKERCRGAYILSAELTGVSQTAALIFALVFGFSANKFPQTNAPLILAAVVGLIGYVALGILKSPMTGGKDGTPFVFLIMVMLGFSQIGAIVCSLGLLGRCILGLDSDESPVSPMSSGPTANGPHLSDAASAPLLPKADGRPSYEDLKGSIAGTYSLVGGIGILLLTKLGGFLFDRVSTAAPFYILAIFNATLIAAMILNATLTGRQKAVGTS